MPPKMVNLQLSQEKFVRTINKLMQATKANTADILKQATVDFTEFAAKATEPAKGKANIPAKKYKREIIELVKRGRNRKEKGMFAVFLKHSGKPVKIVYGSTRRSLQKYVKVSYRGLGRAGWFLRQQQAIGIGLTSAEQNILQKSPDIAKQGAVNSITATPDRVTIINNSPDIASYGDYARIKGYNAASRKLDRLRRNFLKSQEANPL